MSAVAGVASVASVAKVGIVGASGYMGGEALRVLAEHPQVELAWATSRRPGPAESFHPNLLGSGLELIAPERATPCDVVFLAVPGDASVRETERFLAQGARVVDLGSAFRLRDRASWERVYGRSHPRWELTERAVYGIPELYADEIAAAPLVANPGCFASAAILGLAPLLREGWVDATRLVVNGLSGSAGMGAAPDRVAHHAEIGNNAVVYNAVDHRHGYEMEQELSRLAGVPVCVHFTPVYVPIVRGILDVCHAFAARDVKRADVLELYRDFYRDEPFVRVCDTPDLEGDAWRHRAYPWVSAVAGTNYCFLGIDVDRERGRIVALSVLDSVGKGGAQVGVENMNLLLGLPRTTGLERRGLHPA